MKKLITSSTVLYLYKRLTSIVGLVVGFPVGDDVGDDVGSAVLQSVSSNDSAS